MNENNYYVPQDNGTDLHARVDSAFVRGLISAIIAWYPIASIAALVLGRGAFNEIESVRAEAARRNIKLSGKNIAARVLGMVGKYGGITLTVYYAIVITAYLLMIVFNYTGSISLMQI